MRKGKVNLCTLLQKFLENPAADEHHDRLFFRLYQRSNWIDKITYRCGEGFVLISSFTKTFVIKQLIQLMIGKFQWFYRDREWAIRKYDNENHIFLPAVWHNTTQPLQDYMGFNASAERTTQSTPFIFGISSQQNRLTTLPFHVIPPIIFINKNLFLFLSICNLQRICKHWFIILTSNSQGPYNSKLGGHGVRRQDEDEELIYIFASLPNLYYQL